jgi:hypothetical protein
LRDLISKITRTKWTGGVAQAVESLLCKPRAPSSYSKLKGRKEGRKENREKEKREGGREGGRKTTGLARWHMTTISATQEAEAGS